MRLSLYNVCITVSFYVYVMREKINKHINLRLTSDWLQKQRVSEAAGQDGAGTLMDGEHKSIIILS